MNTDIILSLTSIFEAHAQQTEDGVEYWLARDLQHLLGYAEWRNFNQSAIFKARIACEISGHPVSYHFVDANKMVDLGSGGKREIEDILLTRYACYLIAQNGDPRKEEIAFAQTYFAVQTRRAELGGNIEHRTPNIERRSEEKRKMRPALQRLTPDLPVAAIEGAVEEIGVLDFEWKRKTREGSWAESIATGAWTGEDDA